MHADGTRALLVIACLLVVGACGSTPGIANETPTASNTNETDRPPTTRSERETSAAMAALERVDYVAEVTPSRLVDIDGGSDLRTYEVTIDRVEWEAGVRGAPMQGDVVRLGVRHWRIAPGEAIRVAVWTLGAAPPDAPPGMHHGFIRVVTNLDGMVQRPTGGDAPAVADLVDAEADLRATDGVLDLRAALVSLIESAASSELRSGDASDPAPTNRP